MDDPSIHLDRVIHEKGRLGIMSMLAATPGLAFTELREALGMTDGNLTTHLKTLQQSGYVVLSKTYSQQRPLTTCALTESGETAFRRYVNLLDDLVQRHRGRG